MQDGDLADRAVVVAQCGGGFDDFQQAGALVQRNAHFLALLGGGLLGGADEVVAAAADGHEADAGLVEALQAGVGGEAADSGENERSIRRKMNARSGGK